MLKEITANRHIASHSLVHFYEVLNQINAEAVEKFHIGILISQKITIKRTPQPSPPKIYHIQFIK